MSSASFDEQASAGANREFQFTAQDFSRVCALIYARAGIALSESKQALVYGRLARRLRAIGKSSFSHYLDHLEAESDPQEWQEFTNALTTNLTSFMREAHHFESLATHLKSLARTQPIKIWCSAASTGEEPYSIAMTAQDALGSAANRVKILATDIDTAVLQIATAGIYPLQRLEGLPMAARQRYFLRGQNHKSDMVRAKENLRAMISFKQLNLLDPVWPMKSKFDVIFCRNVLIYFDKSTQQTILRRMRECLNIGGVLFIGHSENIHAERRYFEIIGKSSYRKIVGQQNE